MSVQLAFVMFFSGVGGCPDMSLAQGVSVTVEMTVTVDSTLDSDTDTDSVFWVDDAPLDTDWLTDVSSVNHMEKYANSVSEWNKRKIQHCLEEKHGYEDKAKTGKTQNMAWIHFIWWGGGGGGVGRKIITASILLRTPKLLRGVNMTD